MNTHQYSNFKTGNINEINSKYTKLLQRNDRYEYSYIKILKKRGKK